MRYITHIHLSGGTSHEHITDVLWSDPGSGETGKRSTRAEMVSWIQGGGDARVQSRPVDVKVEVIRASPPYLRTVRDGVPTNNLLELPKF